MIQRNQSAAFSSGKVRPNHETNINIIARRTGKDVNSHTVLDGIITTIMATIQRINIIGSREGSRNRRRLKANQTGKKFRVGIKSNISTNRNNLISGVDRCIHLSMQISISSLQTHNVNRCGRSRHLARKLSLRRKRSSPNVFEMAATETITSIILIKLIRVSLGTVRHPRRFKIVVIDIQITLKQMLRDFIGIRVNRAKKSGMVNITSSVNSRERSGINTILHELNPLFTINVTMRDIKSKNVYSRVNSKATTQWRKTESANGVHLEGVASDNRSS